VRPGETAPDAADGDFQASKKISRKHEPWLKFARTGRNTEQTAHPISTSSIE
jgi:hypothetical protein